MKYPGLDATRRALEPALRIDLVITDQVMPRMTGLQLADAIKARWPTLPVILATGFAETPAHVRDFARLSKPFSQAQLAEMLTNVHPMPGKARVLKFPGASPKN